MKRSIFLIVAAIIPLLFGSVMMLIPGQMLSNSLLQAPDAQTIAVTQWVGFGIFTVGVINFLCRNEAGSLALKAVIIVNIVFHSLGIFFDAYHYSLDIMTFSGFITGLIPHLLLVKNKNLINRIRGSVIF